MAPTTPKPRPNPRRKEYSPHTRGRIFTAADKGTKIKDIANEFKVPIGSVNGIIKRYRTQAKGCSRHRSGRPGILSERDKRHILRALNTNPFLSALEIKDNCGILASRSTISENIKETGLGHWKALRRVKLTPEQAAKRLEFCRLYERKTVDWWKGVIFSDETSIQRGCGDYTKWVWCPKVSFILFLFYK